MRGIASCGLNCFVWDRIVRIVSLYGIASCKLHCEIASCELQWDYCLVGLDRAGWFVESHRADCIVGLRMHPF